MMNWKITFPIIATFFLSCSQRHKGCQISDYHGFTIDKANITNKRSIYYKSENILPKDEVCGSDYNEDYIFLKTKKVNNSIDFCYYAINVDSFAVNYGNPKNKIAISANSYEDFIRMLHSECNVDTVIFCDF